MTADGLSGGHLVWFEMSRGRFVGGQIVKAPHQVHVHVPVDALGHKEVHEHVH